MVDRLKISNVNSYSSFSLLRLVFWKSIHLEVASDSFCFLINSSWLLVFILYVFSLFFSGFNLARAKRERRNRHVLAKGKGIRSSSSLGPALLNCSLLKKEVLGLRKEDTETVNR